MLTDREVLQPEESLKTAKNRIRLGAAPAWVQTCPFRTDFKGKQPGHVTHLLFDQQINAELGQTFYHVALRLDTMQAVQNQSPWRLEFESRHQQITLHSIKAWRGETQIDHANLSTARIIDRDPPGFAGHDRLALLLMLEDIRPGDVLEWSYTIEDRPLLLADHCSSMFTLPAGAPVGKFHFSARFDRSRPMQWKSWSPEWQPITEEKEDERVLTWTQENYPGLEAEQNTPAWHIDYPWIQVSDCPDWGMIARAFAEAWEEVEEDAVVGEIASEIAAGEGTIHQQTEKAIQLVQDEYRYLEFDGKFDEQRPTAPGIVAKRRYGDCKDLSFLLLHLLKRLGVQARLVLVNTVFRKSLAELLPSPVLFDHLLVEYEIRGEKRWVDATLKRQGGGSLNRVIRDYGAGVPIAIHSTGLIEPPEGSAGSSVYELTESILLDTFGGWSWLGVVVAASGSHAEELRSELESEGLEALAKKRLRQYAERFTHARRIGELTYRDDRVANEFFLAEVFEIKDFLTVDPKTKWYQLELTNDYALSLLKKPDPDLRRAPFALPHPCNIVHTIELHSVALPPAVVQQRTVESDFLYFNRTRKTLAGNWTMRLTLSTLTDAVLPEDLDDYQKAMREIREQCVWKILVPAGDARPHQRGDFAALPTSWESSFSMPVRRKSAVASAVASAAAKAMADRKAMAAAPTIAKAVTDSPPSINEPEKSVAAASAIPAVAEALAGGPSRKAETLADAASADEPQKHSRRKKRVRRKRDPVSAARWQIVRACAFGLILILIVVLVAKNADHWHIFKLRPTPPVPADDLGM